MSAQQQQQQQPDVLFSIRNSFYIGNYQQTINEANKLFPKLDEARGIEAKTYLYRAYIAQKKFNIVIGEINETSSPVELQCVKLLAAFLQSEKNQEAALAALHSKLSQSSNTFGLFVNGIMHYHQGNYNEVLKLHASTHLESIALMVQTYLKMNLLERAKKELKRMQEIDDDSTLTQLTTAWVNIAAGGDKYQEAYYIFQELAEKYTPTVMLLNGQAVCYMHIGKLEEAEGLLQEALDKDNSDPDTLVNLITVSLQLNKAPELVSRFLNQLKDEAPNHPFTKDYVSKEKEFDRAAGQVSVDVV